MVAFFIENFGNVDQHVESTACEDCPLGKDPIGVMVFSNGKSALQVTVGH